MSTTSTTSTTPIPAHALPDRAVMVRAMLDRDSAFEGLFIVAVKTTGIFCRPVCPARKPKPENVEFYADARQAMLHGFRPCKRCRPLEPAGSPPDWLRPVLDDVAGMEVPRLSDRELRGRGVDPGQVRRWFKRHHGVTFQAWLRAQRVGKALGKIQAGESVTASAFDVGYESLSGFAHAWTRHLSTTPREGSRAQVITVTRITTPLGPMLAGVYDDALCLLDFVDRPALNSLLSRTRQQLNADVLPGDHPLFDRVAVQLREYYAGQRREFDLPLRLVGTEFQRRVWEALLAIPFGETRSYRQQAQAIGQPVAVRAVGRANGANRIAIVVPCHRVIGEDGSLTGYGGGLERKRYLLALEQRGADPSSS